MHGLPGLHMCKPVAGRMRSGLPCIGDEKRPPAVGYFSR